jgi:hypothetical protein
MNGERILTDYEHNEKERDDQHEALVDEYHDDDSSDGEESTYFSVVFEAQCT